MSLTDALAAATDANNQYLQAAATYVSLVQAGSPQPQTASALAVAGAKLAALKLTQGNVDAAYGAL
jgi:hypothetical protein